MNRFKSGDRVRVRKPADVDQEPGWSDEMDKFDGTEQEIEQIISTACIVKFAGDCDRWAFHFDWLEPVKPKTLNVGEPVEPIQSWVPEGYSVVEMAVPDAMAAAIGEGNALVWRKAKIGELYLSGVYKEVAVSAIGTETFSNVIVPTTPPAEQYREPTQADVGRMVEVRDREQEPWQARELLAVIVDKNVDQRFVCRDRNSERQSLNWKYAQIKIEEVR